MNIFPFVTVQGDTTNSDYKFSKTPYRIAKLKVEKIFKGKQITDTITIITASDGRGCGSEFIVNQAYILHAQIIESLHYSSKYKIKPKNNVYWTHVCSRTTPWTINEERAIQRLTQSKKYTYYC